MVVFGLLCMSMAAAAEERRGSRLWKWSLAVLAAANVADAATSLGHRELNPVLGGGPFGARSVGVKMGIAGGGVAIQYLILRHRPAAAPKAAVINFAMAGVTGGIAARNTRH